MNWKRGLTVVLLALVGGIAAHAAKETKVTSGVAYWDAAAWDNGLPADGDTVIISGSGTKVYLTNSSPVLAVFVVTNSAQLIFNGWDTVLTSTEVRVFATITHTNNTDTVAPWEPNARVKIICTNLYVAPNCAIEASNLGYPPGYASAAGYGPGRGASGFWGGGAGHGGIGYPVGADGTGSTYDVESAPVEPGSGGGGGNGTTYGGAGGGAVWIEATDLVTISATYS